IDAKGNLRITRASSPCGYGPETETAVLVKRGDEKVAVKVKHTSVILTTVELPASAVEAYTADGKPISAEKLATALAKERTVLVALDGRKVDPFLLQLYKDDAIVLVPPANTLGALQGGPGLYAPRPQWGGVPSYPAPPDPDGAPGKGPPPPEPKKPPPDGRQG